MEDFPSLEIPNVNGLIPDFKPYLVVKIIDIQVPANKEGLESGFGSVKFENPTPREVLPPGEISWHPLAGAIAQHIPLQRFELCSEVCTCKLHNQPTFSLNSPAISYQLLLDMCVSSC